MDEDGQPALALLDRLPLVRVLEEHTLEKEVFLPIMRLVNVGIYNLKNIKSW